MMGLSNVYELIDADTHSVIALLTSIAMELGVSVLLVTEESRKSINAVYEVVKTRDMVYRAYIRKSHPIDTGIDLLVIKEKRYRGIKPPTTCLKEYVVSDKVIPS
jgi:dihydropteroate synthase